MAIADASSTALSGYARQTQKALFEIEKSKLRREKATIALNKGLLLYFSFLAVGIAGFTYRFIDSTMLNLLVLAGIFILIISTLPYVLISHKEERWIEQRLEELR